jgi:PAS domain S-box-containing protein
MKKIKMAIIGAGREGSALYYCFRMKPNVQIIGIADITGQGFGTDDAAKDGVLVSRSLETIVSLEDLDVIIETTKDPEINQRVHQLKKPQIQVVEASSFELIMALGNKKEKTEAELFSILGSVDDAVQIVDKDGIITFVNKAFERVTGLTAAEMLGKNVLESFPDSPIAKCLTTGEKINGKRYSLGNQKRELTCNVTPIVVRSEVVGAIGVFRLLPDIVKIMEELQRSTSIIEGLYDKLVQINGLPEYNMSDIMPINKMEQILLKQALTKYGYSVEGKKKAAKALNISLATLYNKLKRYEIN